MTISPGVDTSLFTRSTRPPEEGSVVFVGDFRTGLKGLDFLREAIQMVPGSTLHIVGKGPRIDSPRTIYHGVLRGEELISRIQNSQVLVQPADWPEAYPMVLLEAMACGIPVIGTDIGGIPEIIQDREVGLLVPPGNTQALADAISYVLSNSDKARDFANKAFEKIIAEHQWEGKIREFLTEVANSVRSKS